jgi:hypothetical protein
MDPEDIDAFRTSILDLLNHINGTDEFPIENRCKYIKEAIDWFQNSLLEDHNIEVLERLRRC